MTWIIFDNVHVWKLIHVGFLYFFILFYFIFFLFFFFFYYFPDSRRSCHSCWIWNSIASFPDFTVRYGFKIYKWCVWKKYWLLFYSWNGRKLLSVKFNVGILFTSALRASAKSIPRLNFTSGTINFHYSPHEQSIFVYCPTHCMNFVVEISSGHSGSQCNAMPLFLRCVFASQSRLPKS